MKISQGFGVRLCCHRIAVDIIHVPERLFMIKPDPKAAKSDPIGQSLTPLNDSRDKCKFEIE